MNRRDRLEPEADIPSAYYARRRRRSSNARALRRLALPIAAAVLLAMIAIPFFSLGLVGVADVHRGPRDADSSPFAELTRISGEGSDRESQVRSLKQWLKSHYSAEEVEEIREIYLAGREPDEVRAEVAEIAESLSRGEYVDVPRFFSDRLSSRLGRARSKDLKRHFERIAPTPTDLEGLAIEELFPR